MEFLNDVPIWAMAIIIFMFRIIDVSLGTIRTITIIEGLAKLAVILGFFEILIWVLAISQVVTRLGESPLLALAYAGGFSTGNAVGLFIERRLAFGHSILRIISGYAGMEIADALRAEGQILTTFSGEGRDGPVTLIYMSLPRKTLKPMLSIARRIDPDLYYVIERANDSSTLHRLSSTGWRAVVKRK